MFSIRMFHQRENSPTELQPITLKADDLKKHIGLEKLSDEEAENIAETLKEFSLLSYYIFHKLYDEQK